MTFPIFYWSGGGPIYDALNTVIGGIVLVILTALLLIAAFYAAPGNKSEDDRVFAGRFGVASLVSIIVIIIFGAVPFFLAVGMILLLLLFAHMFASAFGHPLW